jgi:hypothetical protein
VLRDTVIAIGLVLLVPLVVIALGTPVALFVRLLIELVN